MSDENSNRWMLHDIYHEGFCCNRTVTRSQAGFVRIKNTESDLNIFVCNEKQHPTGMPHLITTLKGEYGAVPRTSITRSLMQYIPLLGSLSKAIGRYKAATIIDVTRNEMRKEESHEEAGFLSGHLYKGSYGVKEDMMRKDESNEKADEEMENGEINQETEEQENDSDDDLETEKQGKGYEEELQFEKEEENDSKEELEKEAERNKEDNQDSTDKQEERNEEGEGIKEAVNKERKKSFFERLFF